MSTTIPGGLYLSEDGVTYHDANGKVIESSPKSVVSEQESADTPFGGVILPTKSKK